MNERMERKEREKRHNTRRQVTMSCNDYALTERKMK